MATTMGKNKVGKDVQKRLIEHLSNIMTSHNQHTTTLRNKLTYIDKAYARYNAKDVEAGNVVCNASDDDIIAPIVVSEVDSMLAYLSEVFLSGSPIFPVVSTPRNRNYAEQLETLVDDHANLGGYARQLLLFLTDAVKFNFSALENTWTSLEQFSVASDFEESTGRKLERQNKSYTKIRRLDPYNTIFDHTVSPADVSMMGDYAGDIQILSRTKLKRLMAKLKKEGKLMNENLALNNNSANWSSVNGVSNEYKEKPVISDYIPTGNRNKSVDWFKYFGDGKKLTGPGDYELITLYVRIIPSDYLMNVPQPDTPQIWKMEVVNSKIIINAERIISAYDCLPILFGQPLEDGMGLQTKSLGEGSIPFQEAATKLYNVRFAAARRAVSDRALYDPDMINPKDINAAVAAPKIPVRGSAMKEKALQAAYHQIPFDIRGTETTLQDAAQIANFSKELSGINNPMRGQFQKGNKSVKEWDDTMSGADGRMRLRALCLELQVFVPLKENIKLNIFQYGEDAVVVSNVNGKDYAVKIDELRKQVLSFKIADGYAPKSKLANVDTLTMGFQLIQASPMLQEAYGSSLPAMFAHMMSLGGVKGLEEYNPANQVDDSSGNLAGNMLQGTAEGAAPTQPALAPPVEPSNTTPVA